MSDLPKRLRSVPASMIGTEFEDAYWRCHDAASWIDAFLDAERRSQEAFHKLINMTSSGSYRYGWYEGVLCMIERGHVDDPVVMAAKALDRFEDSRGSTQKPTSKPRKASKK